MKITIEKKYLIVPVSRYAVTKALCFYETQGDEQVLVMDFECKLDVLNPTYTAYIDVTRHKGKTLEYSSVPHMDFLLLQSDEKKIDGLYQEEFRPFSHYTPQLGWINDPNGLIKYHGVYHMFYQYNPLGIERGHMHWGHAISRDLLHWEEQDIALFPDETGTMYSGSAIEDVKNLTGLQTNENPPMLLYYTAAGDKGLISKCKQRTQCLAYSNDGGKTFEKYKENPVVPWMEGGNRDPKIIWVDELSKYVMLLYIAGDRYSMLTSENLLDWTPLQEINITAESECPDIMPFKVGGKQYWVIIGGSDKYVIGTFEKGAFVQKSVVKQLTYSPGRCSYAAQSFSGVDDGRVLRLTWDRLHMPSDRVPHQMSIPTEMKLEQTDIGCFLTSNPIREIKNLYADTSIIKNKVCNEPLIAPLERAAYDVHFVADYEHDLEFEFFGHKLLFKTEENWIEFQRTRVPISLYRDKIDVRMIIDRCSIEIFADGGKFCATFSIVCDYNLPYIKVSPTGELTVDRLECNRLKSIHEEGSKEVEALS